MRRKTRTFNFSKLDLQNKGKSWVETEFHHQNALTPAIQSVIEGPGVFGFAFPKSRFILVEYKVFVCLKGLNFGNKNLKNRRPMTNILRFIEMSK